MTVVKIALLGAGTVGTQVARLLSEQKEDLAARSGAQLELVGIAVRDVSAPRDPAVDRSLLTDDPVSIIDEADIVIELMGGIEPARAYIFRAFAAGASVVTGNKALLAAHGPELYEAAARADVDLYYEAAVAGAVGYAASVAFVRALRSSESPQPDLAASVVGTHTVVEAGPSVLVLFNGAYLRLAVRSQDGEPLRTGQSVRVVSLMSPGRAVVVPVPPMNAKESNS